MIDSYDRAAWDAELSDLNEVCTINYAHRTLSTEHITPKDTTHITLTTRIQLRTSHPTCITHPCNGPQAGWNQAVATRAQ